MDLAERFFLVSSGLDHKFQLGDSLIQFLNSLQILFLTLNDMLLSPKLGQLQSLSGTLHALEVLILRFFDELKIFAYLGITELAIQSIDILRSEVQVDGFFHMFDDGSDLHLAFLDLCAELLNDSI